MLPLSDRMLLALRECPMPARHLSQGLGVDVGSVHMVLRGLEAQGVVERYPVEGEQALLWRLAPGVRVTLHPSRVEVEGAHPQASRGARKAPCRAVTPRGRPCRLQPMASGLCYLHAGGAGYAEA